MKRSFTGKLGTSFRRYGRESADQQDGRTGYAFRKAFEQLALENLSEVQFKALTGSYEDEKQELPSLSDKLEQEIYK